MRYEEGDEIVITDGHYKGIVAEIEDVGKKHYKARVLDDPNNTVNWTNIIIDDKYLVRVSRYNEEDSAKDKQVGGSHYKQFNIQPAEFIFENGEQLHPNDSVTLWNVIKYIMRHREKGGEEDLEKAEHYIQLLREHTYE